MISSSIKKVLAISFSRKNKSSLSCTNVADMSLSYEFKITKVTVS